MTHVVVLSDTHMGPTTRRRLPAGVYLALESADLVLHAGDIVTSDLVQELSGFAPTLAVLGNNDVDPDLSHLPETRLEVIEGVTVAMVHDSGPRAGRAARMRRRFPDADVVVFGHSHSPWNEPGIDGQLLFNPGSPTERRAQPHRTIGVLQLEAGQVVRREVVAV
ncbi:MAG: metallophosphatase family protein [Actinomycetota bacterium]|nr:metallophosphatase family protein [Actinomycetota bacterium]MDQ3679851.1 metallophosphatase family protein [Actinomycetota bacterium]